MSVTGHNEIRDPDDFYATPKWCVDVVLPYLPDLRGLSILEPGCGDGAIMRALPPGLAVSGVELNAARASRARDLRRGVVYRADFLEWAKNVADHEFDLAIGNPPFKLAMDFVRETHRIARVVAFLLRLPFLCSRKRNEWLRAHTPTINALSERPEFVMSIRCKRFAKKRDRGRIDQAQACTFEELRPIEADRPKCCPLCAAAVTISTTDSADYAWFVWDQNEARVRVLPLTGDGAASEAAE